MRQFDRQKVRKTQRCGLLEQEAGRTAHRLLLAHGLAVGARASDVEEGLFLGSREGRRGSADVTASGRG